MSKKAMKLALEALEEATIYTNSTSFSPSLTRECKAAATALREALAEQPEPMQQCMKHGECFGGKCIYPAPQPPAQQQPVAWAMYQRDRLLSFWMDKGDAYDFEFTTEHRWEPLYTSPPAQRKPLTVEQMAKALPRPWPEEDDRVCLNQTELRQFANNIKEQP